MKTPREIIQEEVISSQKKYSKKFQTELNPIQRQTAERACKSYALHVLEEVYKDIYKELLPLPANVTLRIEDKIFPTK